MKRDSEQSLTDAPSTPPDIHAFANPLDFIAEVHMREREICTLIDTMATSSHPEKDDRKQVVAFLKHHLLQHLADEESDLFPMMLERCDPEDEIDKVIGKLRSDHRYAVTDAPALLALLEDPEVQKRIFSEKERIQMTEFATHARRHLVLENAVVMPIARARLNHEDLETMRQHMLERRSIALREESRNAQ